MLCILTEVFNKRTSYRNFVCAKVPTWHEVRQADSSLVALHLSKAPNFDQFSDLLVSSLKVLQKYDRLGTRVGADKQTFLDELKVVRVRMEQMCLRREQLRGAGPLTQSTSVDSSAMSSSWPHKPQLPPPPIQEVMKRRSLPAPPVTPAVPQPIPLSDVVSR